MKDFGIYVSKVGSDQLFIVASASNTKKSAPAIAESIYREIESVLAAHGMKILHERVFGTLRFYERFIGIRRKLADFFEGPFSYIQGKPFVGEGLAGVQVHAVKSMSEKDYWIIWDDNNPSGIGWKRDGTTYVHLAGLTGNVAACKTRREQTFSMFDNLSRVLASQGLGFTDVRRTWIYLQDILDWYEEFNSIRNEKFRELGLIPPDVADKDFDTLCLPASTGIGGENVLGAAISADVLAISGNLRSAVLPGVRQKSAFRYGSAFSRGIYFKEKDGLRIYVSGTAAIDKEGKSLYQSRAEGQIEETIEIVEALIGEKGAKLSDIRSATVYLKRPDEWAVYKQIAAKHNLEDLPAVIVNADICRDELLFEMDAVAIVDVPCAV
jgi:enamine deaminase RidA (YjgF/YER057c/UK114 family)